MSKKVKTFLYVLLVLAALAVISIWADWNITHRAEFNAMSRQADSFYEKGDYQAASALYKELLSQRPRKRQVSVGEGAIIFFLLGATIILAYLYVDKNRNLLTLVSKSARSQNIPEVLGYDIDFDKISVSDDNDAKLLADLRDLLENKEVFLDKSLTIESLAKMAGTNKARMSQFINKVFGCNFPTLLSNYRVTKAVAMFSDPANSIYTVEAIGENCGFNNRQAFHSSFKKKIGMPPSKFRELIKKTD
ncbi:MAG: helix-turn-helix transcriptional regulator [Bacteroidales bacterium]|nr:helix-turn-helix transcriptional regulator [Bacteroidales bacterium]MBO7585051.1 helix-turn-helix transcriptional regulator [Bacteroidales bacterium]